MSLSQSRQFVAENGDSRQKVTVSEFGDSRRLTVTIAEIGDYILQCGQGFRLYT